MEKVQIKFVKTHKHAKLPKLNHKDKVQGTYKDKSLTGDTGYDIFACQNIVIPRTIIKTGELEPIIGSAIVPVGLKVGYISPGYWFKIQARSGLGFKHSIFPHFGIIDNGYRGDLGIKLYNLSQWDYKITKGQAIAQLVVYPIIRANISYIDQQVESDRGQKGFGSSDLHAKHLVDNDGNLIEEKK